MAHIDKPGKTELVVYVLILLVIVLGGLVANEALQNIR